MKSPRRSLNFTGAELSASSVENPRQHWFIKYKIYHLVFWSVYHYAWMAINSGDPIASLGYMFVGPKYAMYVVLQALAVCFNLYFLIPRYLEKGRYFPYLFCLLLTISATSAIIATGYYWTAYLQQRTVLELYGSSNFFHYFLTYTLPSTITSMMLAMSIRLTKNWMRTKRREQLLEKEKLETELKFLRSQFNPHFLFNTINSIFVLIHKNPDMASEALAKFSDLLRYQLYECNEHEIPLRQELLYLQNYLELERLRLDSRNCQLSIQLDRPQTADLTIAPFVLIPFVENAFKHVSQRRDQLNWISLLLSFDGHRLLFTVANSASRLSAASREPGLHRGIGLKNVQRRLNLIYPEQHALTIRQDEGQFSVKLSLELHEHAIPEPAAWQPVNL